MRNFLNMMIGNNWTFLSAVAFMALVLAVSVDKFAPKGDAVVVQRSEVVHVTMTFPTRQVAGRDFMISVDHGTGVLVSEGKVLTNWHVIRGHARADRIEVEFSDGTVRSAKVVKLDRINDLALLKIAPVLITPAIPGRTVMKGDTVTIAGFPGGGEYREVTGKVVGWGAPLPTGPDTIFKVNANTAPGMSGGPVYSSKGHMVGLLFGCLDYANCVTIEKITEFLSN